MLRILRMKRIPLRYGLTEVLKIHTVHQGELNKFQYLVTKLSE